LENCKKHDEKFKQKVPIAIGRGVLGAGIYFLLSFSFISFVSCERKKLF